MLRNVKKIEEINQQARDLSRTPNQSLRFLDRPPLVVSNPRLAANEVVTTWHSSG